VDWIYLAQDTLDWLGKLTVGLLSSIKGREFLDELSDLVF
jgi:hypothetical protein